MQQKGKMLLVCDICKNVNYTTNKSNIERLEIKKYCKHCREHTLHKENK